VDGYYWDGGRLRFDVYRHLHVVKSNTMAKLTPQEKLNKQQRDSLNVTCNRISSAFSFHKIKTWSDVYKFTAVPPNSTPEHLSSSLTFPELKVYLESLRKNLESRLAEPITMLAPPNTVVESSDVKPQPVLPSPVTHAPEPELIVDPSHIPSLDNDYLLPPSAREHKDLIRYWFQRKAAKEGLDAIVKEDKRALQIIAAAGYGKTFIAGAMAVRLVDMNFTRGKSYGPVKFLYVTKNSIVEQTKRVFEKMFNLGVKDCFEVINYEQLRSKAGALWVREKVLIVGGEEQITWEWRPMFNPVVIFWDENHSLKNYTSTQHKIACQFNEIATPTYQIFISATPYTRVSEAKCFAVATRKSIGHIIGTDSTISNLNWPTYAACIAGSASNPEEYNEAAVERLTKDLESYIIRVRGVRPQFKAINSIKMIDFADAEEKKYYDETEERYIKEKAKLEQNIEAGLVEGGGIHHLVLLTKRAIAAEYCRRKHFVRFMVDSVKNGYAAACAVKYKTTLIPMVKIMVEEYGIPRDQIALVWGGGQTQLTKKQKQKAEINEKADLLIKAGMDKDQVFTMLGLEDVEDRVLEELPEELRLGSQSLEERQREIDRFQSGRALYCIYTFKAGGVGLSLHHTDEQTKEKVRRQKSGYAVIEDIPKIPTRQRRTALSVAYSGIDMVQSIGRVPRLTSLSDTEQFCFLYNQTVEVDIAHVYSSKLRCLNKVVRNNESWMDIIMGSNRAQLVQEHIKNDKDQDPDEDPTTGESDDE